MQIYKVGDKFKDIGGFEHRVIDVQIGYRKNKIIYTYMTVFINTDKCKYTDVFVDEHEDKVL